MKQNKARYTEVLVIAVGELIVSLLDILGYLVAHTAFGVPFTYRIFTGAALGSAAIIVNLLFLSVSVNKVIDEFIEIRGTREMDDEEAEEFTKQHSMRIQNRITLSFIIRTVSMLATLLVAFLLDWFEPIATVIPLFMYRPILTVGNMVVNKFAKHHEEGSFDKSDAPIVEKKEEI